MYKIIATTGGEATAGAMPSSARQSDAATPTESNSAPAPGFDQILESLVPGASRDMRTLEYIARNHLTELLSALPRHAQIPLAADIPELVHRYGNTPLLLERPATVADMAAYLQSSNDDREIGLHIFGDSYVLILGEENGMTPPYAWHFVEKVATAAIHTHPEDSRYPDKHYPSIHDLNQAKGTSTPQLVLSTHGVILYPSREEYSVLPDLLEYGFTQPKSSVRQEDSDPEEVFRRSTAQKNTYAKEVLKLTVIPWDTFPSDMSIQEVTEYALSKRRQQYESGELPGPE